MRTYHILIWLLGALLLQPAAAILFSVHGIGPDLLLCAVIFLVFLYHEPGVVIGLAVLIAFLRDLSFSLHAGTGAAGIFAAGICALLAVKFCSWERLSFFVLFTAFDAFVWSLTVWAAERLLGNPVTFLHMLKAQPFFMAYQVGLALIFYFAVVKQRQGRCRV